MDVSVVIPVKNEAANIALLVAEIAAALDGRAYEIVYVDDGSGDGTSEALAAAAQATPQLRFLRHARSCGQSAAIRTGIAAARGVFIATLDGDGQNDPADIPRLLEIAQAAAPERRLLVAGRRARRRDSLAKRLASRLANAVRARLLQDDTPDTGCGLKVLRRDLYLDLPYFDHNHRFLPALVLRQGGSTLSVPVNHRPRQRGRSNYGIFDRLWAGIADLLGMMWLMRRMRRPELVAPPEAEPKPKPVPETGAVVN